MKKLMLAALAIMPLAHAGEFEDFGRVTQVRPQVEQVNRPRQECRTEYVQVPVQQRQERSAGGAIVGGVIGAVLGNQVGGGSGRAAATAAGAIAGAVVGDRAENDGRQTSNAPAVTEQAVRQCRTVDSWESRTVGYEVTYEYRGRNYTSNMSYDPGQRVRLRVMVEPQQR